MDKDKILEFWDKRAAIGINAGSDDYVGKELEIGALSRHIRGGMKVAEFGCGSGMTAIALASKYDIQINCFDFSQEMINVARKLAKEAGVEHRITFGVADVRNESPLPNDFDIIFTQRAIINLSNWNEQSRAIRYFISHLKQGGHYLMCENSSIALAKINELRSLVGLDLISPPWHNLYLNDKDISELKLSSAKLIEVEPFMSTYYFLSRIVNAWLAKREGKIPEYNAPVNQLALMLPAFGDCSQTKLWVFEKL